jgi:hypothetical protein
MTILMSRTPAHPFWTIPPFKKRLLSQRLRSTDASLISGSLAEVPMAAASV